jgi:hypothetical protein
MQKSTKNINFLPPQAQVMLSKKALNHHRPLETQFLHVFGLKKRQ